MLIPAEDAIEEADEASAGDYVLGSESAEHRGMCTDMKLPAHGGGLEGAPPVTYIMLKQRKRRKEWGLTSRQIFRCNAA